MKTLRDAKVGDTVTVVKLHGEGAVKRRIMDMGITKGVALHVRKVAPLGDPMELNVRGYELSVRKADAEMIEIPGYVRAAKGGTAGRYCICELVISNSRKRKGLRGYGAQDRAGGEPELRQDDAV